MVTTVNILLAIAAVYLLCGLLFAIAFITKGVSVVDESAQGAGIGFRIIIIPGVMLFWPFLLIRWIKACKGWKKIS